MQSSNPSIDTPGKPMQLFDRIKPAESIIARHAGTRYELIVGKNGSTAYSETSAQLSRQEWDGLVALVRQRDLLRFKPDAEKGPVYDYGASGFAIDGTKANAQEWFTGIRNSAAPQALMLRLAQLVRQRLPRITLYYFPSDAPTGG